MGWAVALIGGVMQAGSANKQGQRDEKTAEANQRLANYQADDALARGTIEEARFRRQLAGFVGKQRNAIGARNVEARGSALRLLEDTAALGDEDAITIRNNAARESWGYRNQANEAARWGATQKSNARDQAAGTLLTSGLQAYGQWKASQ